MEDYIDALLKALSSESERSKFYDWLHNITVSVCNPAQKSILHGTLATTPDIKAKIHALFNFVSTLSPSQQKRVFDLFLKDDILKDNINAEIQLLLIPLRNDSFKIDLCLKRKLGNRFYALITNDPELKKIRQNLYNKYGSILGSSFNDCWNETLNQCFLEALGRYNPRNPETGEIQLFWPYFSILIKNRFLDIMNPNLNRRRRPGTIIYNQYLDEQITNNDGNSPTYGETIEDIKSQLSIDNYSTRQAVIDLLETNPHRIFDTKHLKKHPEITFGGIALLLIKEGKTQTEIAELLLGNPKQQYIISRFLFHHQYVVDYFLPYIVIYINAYISLSEETKKQINKDVEINFGKKKCNLSNIYFPSNKHQVINFKDILSKQINGMIWYDLTKHIAKLMQDRGHQFNEKEFIIWYLDTIEETCLTAKEPAAREQKLSERTYLFDILFDFRLYSV